MKRIFLLLIVLISQVAVSQTLQLKWSTDTLLRIPESVLFDAKANVLYVSNIVGKSNEKDGNGFISKLSPDGKIISLQWCATGLNAPKGMGISDGKLFVADLTGVAVIDLGTGKNLNRYELDGAQFLNDITVDKKGRVYVSDSQTGKIHLIDDNKTDVYFDGSKDFKRVNGLLALQDGLYVADAGSGVNYKLDNNKQLTKYTETALGADGIVALGKNEYIVSSWGGEVYFVDANAKATKLLDTKDQKLNSADVDYNQKTHTLFVPTFNGNRVMAYDFKR